MEFCVRDLISNGIIMVLHTDVFRFIKYFQFGVLLFIEIAYQANFKIVSSVNISPKKGQLKRRPFAFNLTFR